MDFRDNMSNVTKIVLSGVASAFGFFVTKLYLDKVIDLPDDFGKDAVGISKKVVEYNANTIETTVEE